MELIVSDVAFALLNMSTKDTKPIDLVKTGVQILQNKPISKQDKKEILKAILTKIAMGEDGVIGTFDDRLSPETLNTLLVIIDSEMIDFVIAGIVSVSKKEGFKSVFNRCGVCIQWKAKVR
jgi:hypothetical protein